MGWTFISIGDGATLFITAHFIFEATKSHSNPFYIFNSLLILSTFIFVSFNYVTGTTVSLLTNYLWRNRVEYGKIMKI